MEIQKEINRDFIYFLTALNPLMVAQQALRLKLRLKVIVAYV